VCVFACFSIVADQQLQFIALNAWLPIGNFLKSAESSTLRGHPGHRPTHVRVMPRL
jgi:hypothetical protein